MYNLFNIRRWICTVFIIYLGNECYCLQNVRLSMPFAIQRGHPAVFQCLYDLEGDTLYSVKWYKGVREFYRFTQTDSPPIKIFPLQGLHIDTTLSNASHLFLNKVESSVAGKYSCEVSADAPSFHTSLVSSETNVVDIPKHTPSIVGIKPKYHLGDILKGNCTSSGSKPAANLTWYINGDIADPKYVKLSRKFRIDNGNLETSQISLRFIVNRHHFDNGRLKIRCVARIYNIYWMSTEKSVDEERPKLSIHNAVTPNTLGVNQLPSPDEFYPSSKGFDDDFPTETRHHHRINMVHYAEHPPSATTSSLDGNSSNVLVWQPCLLLLLLSILSVLL